jgi:hypothetical protein
MLVVRGDAESLAFADVVAKFVGFAQVLCGKFRLAEIGIGSSQGRISG